MQSKIECEVLGLGGVMVDFVLMVSDSFLKAIPGEKGGMIPVDYPTLQQILQKSGVTPTIVPGGSAANTMKGLARFGKKVGMLGKIGKDSMADYYAQAMKERGVNLLTLESETPTAHLLALVTPDGERTFRTFQGASVEMTPSDLNPTFFSGAKLLHVEGYSLFNGTLPEEGMRLAKEMGLKVAFDFASFEIVRAFKPTLWRLLENYVDIVFCNEFEAKELTGKSEIETCRILGDLCEVAVVSLGKRGCFVRKGSEQYACPAFSIDKPLDTTGAGDLFASGFLSGYLDGKSIQESAFLGALAGAEVIQTPGAEIEHNGWQKIHAKIQQGILDRYLMECRAMEEIHH